MIILIYTLIQVIIESLPISSSGHALLFSGPDVVTQGVVSQEVVTEAYDYFLHGFTLLVLAVYFFKEYFFLLRHIYRARIYIARLFFTAVIADCITAVWYVVLPYTSLPQLPLWLGFSITGCALLSTAWFDIISRFTRNHSSQAILYSPLALILRLRSAVNVCLSAEASAKAGSKAGSKGLKERWQMRAALIGFVQGIALITGISRMGVTYTTARWFGLRPYRAMALSLLVQAPLIGAGFLKGLYTLHKTQELAQYLTPQWLIVYSVATGSAYFLFCCTMELARREKLWIFGVYLLVLAASVLFFF